MNVKIAPLFDELRSNGFGSFCDLLIASRPLPRKRRQGQCQTQSNCSNSSTAHVIVSRVSWIRTQRLWGEWRKGQARENNKPLINADCVTLIFAVRSRLTAARLVPILNHAHLFECDQSFLNHLLDHGYQCVDLIGAVHDLDDNWQVFR